MDKIKYIIGIDEVGRGPLAGPVTVAAVAVKIKRLSKNSVLSFKAHKTFFNHILSPRKNRVLEQSLKDSKKLSPKQREEWNIFLRKCCDFHIASVSAKVIDKIGISKAVALAIKRVLKKFSRKPSIVLLDGLLKAPSQYNQRTIVKGDEKKPLIAAASIIAKVARDKKMVQLHKKFPKYRFDKHKGYGTKLHYEMLKKYGLCAEHRKSFCKNF